MKRRATYLAILWIAAGLPALAPPVGLGLGLTLGLAPAARAAMPASSVDLAQAFAACVGRYSASLEHSWLVGLSGDEARTRRETFRTLLEAVEPDARAAGMRPSDLLGYRINAKMAQAQLLSAAQYSDDPRRKRIAIARARSQMRACELLLIG